jgi:hypothetical protein
MARAGTLSAGKRSFFERSLVRGSAHDAGRFRRRRSHASPACASAIDQENRMSTLETTHADEWSGTRAPAWSEDWLAFTIGLAIVVDPGAALAPASKAYAALGGAGAFIATYLALLVVMSVGAAILKADVRRFAVAFTAVFWIAYASWVIGGHAHIAAVTPAEFRAFGIDWSLRLTNEGGYLVALLAGLIVANLFPRFAEWLKAAIRPELYIKIAIVILGAFLAIIAVGKLNLASSLLCAASRRSSRPT